MTRRQSLKSIAGLAAVATNPLAIEEPLDLVLFQETAGGQTKWVAVCLQKYLVCQADSIEEIEPAWKRLLFCHNWLIQKFGAETVCEMAAPEPYWKLHAEGRRLPNGYVVASLPVSTDVWAVIKDWK